MATPLSPQQLVETRKLAGGAAVSSDGSRAVVAVSKYDHESNGKACNLWNIDLSQCGDAGAGSSCCGGGETKAEEGTDAGCCVSRLTHVTSGANIGQLFLANGDLLFCATRSGSQQVWCMPAAAGEAYQVTNEALDVEHLKLVRDASQEASGSVRIAFTMEVAVGKSAEETAAMDKEEAESGCTGVVYDELMVRHWDRWGAYRKRNHVFLVDLQRDGAGGLWTPAGKGWDTMQGMETDCPSKPFNGEEEFCFSADGSVMGMAARPDGVGSAMAWTTNVCVYTASVPDALEGDAPLPFQDISEGNEGIEGNPLISPNGKFLAYVSMARATFESDKREVKLRNLETNETTSFSASLDMSFGELLWSSDSQFLYGVVDWRARLRIVRLVVNDDGTMGDVAVLPGGGSRMCMSLRTINGMDKCLLFVESCMTHPQNIFCVALGDDKHAFVPFDDAPGAVNDGSPAKEYTTQLTDFHSADFANIIISNYDEFYVEGGNDPVHCFYLPPPTVEAGKKYPLLLIIHGGPQGAFMDIFHFRWNLGIFAAAGYGVVAVNFHGSTGFGQAYTDSITGDWGGAPFEDLLRSVDQTIERYSYLDNDRVGALGASYGGYMINWLNGHTGPDSGRRTFRTFVNHDGVFCLRSLYFSTEELWFPEWENGGNPMTGADLETWDPSQHVAKWRTPTLVIQGCKDYRISEAESLSTFTVLRRQGVKARLLIFPDENHWTQKPRNHMKWQTEIFRWLAETL